MFKTEFSIPVMVCTLLVLLISPPIEAKKFKLATTSPDGLASMKQLRIGAKEIKQKTDGRVDFRIYSGGVMGDDEIVIRKMGIGALHGGVLSASSLTFKYPDLQIYNLPLAFHNSDEVDYVRTRMDERIIQGLYDNGIVSFSLTEIGFAYLMTKNPVTSVAELRNTKLWVPAGDPIAAKQIQSFGISPIPLSITDVLAGLQTGLIDAVMVPPNAAIALQWHNHVKYVTNLPIMYIYSMLTIDKKAFESITDEDQKIVRQIMDKIYRNIDAENRADNDEAYAALLTLGLTEVQPDLSQLDSWRATANTSIKTLVDSKEISQESVDILLQHLSTFRSASPDKSGE
jgi:TRAP-type C4-dicarboxylate transport system substrate-binding protein